MMAVAVQTMTTGAVPVPAWARAGSAALTERPAALPALTGLRFVAALWVVFAHLSVWWRPGLVRVPLLAAIVTQGSMAVGLFFVLSGFILAHSYLGRAGALRGPRRAFYAARVARIYPVYLLGLTLALAPYLAWGGDLPASVCRTPVGSGGVIAATLALLQDWLPGGATCLNNPAWSLSVEALFYALFPLMAPAFGRLGPRRLLLCGLLLWAAGTLELAAGDRTPLPFVALFGLGVVAGRLFALCPCRQARATGALATSALGAALALLSSGSAGGPLLWMWLAPCYAVLIYALAHAGAARVPLLGPTLAAGPLIALGEASYALYILHWPLLEWLTHLGLLDAGAPLFGVPAAVATVPWPAALAYLALALAASLLAYRWVEIPARCVLRRRLSGTARPGPASSLKSAMVASTAVPKLAVGGAAATAAAGRLAGNRAS